MRGFGRLSAIIGLAIGTVVGAMVLWASPAWAAPTMTVSPTSGAAGSNVTVSGTECADEMGPGAGGAAIGRDANTNNTLEESEVLDVDFAGATDAGTWTVSLTVPAATASGALLAEGACALYTSEFDYADGTFTVTGSTATTTTTTTTPSSLALNKNTAAPGDTINVQGGGYGQGTTATLTLFSDPVVLGSAVADANGVVRLTVKIPTSTAAGVHRLELRGVDGAGAARVLSSNITIAATLPETGSSTPLRAVAFVGTFTLAAGLVVLAGRRMRDDPLWPI